MDDDTLLTEDKLRMNADFMIRHLSESAGFRLGFNAESVEWLDGFIERQRKRADFKLEAAGGLVQTLGSFLGECMCQDLGAKWVRQDDGQLSVEFSEGNAAFPFNKVRKQFANGAEDSIYSFYQSAAVIFAGR